MHVFFFDIDGTLLLAGGAGQEAMRLAFSSEFDIPSPVAVPVQGCTDRGIARDLFEVHELTDSDVNWRRLRDAYLPQLADQLPKKIGRVLPGVSRLLEYLHGRSDVALGLLTGNIRGAAKLKLSHYRLDRFFQFGGYGDHEPERNDVAREAVAAWDAHCQQAANGDQLWVIGDTPRDIQCGRHIGAKVVAVATGGFTAEQLQEERPDMLFEDFRDAERLIQHIEDQ